MVDNNEVDYTSAEQVEMLLDSMPNHVKLGMCFQLYVCVCVYVCVYVCMYVCIYINVYIYIYIYICTCMYIYVYACNGCMSVSGLNQLLRIDAAGNTDST